MKVHSIVLSKLKSMGLRLTPPSPPRRGVGVRFQAINESISSKRLGLVNSTADLLESDRTIEPYCLNQHFLRQGQQFFTQIIQVRSARSGFKSAIQISWQILDYAMDQPIAMAFNTCGN